MSDYYAPDGKPITADQWAQSFRNPETKFVKQEHVGELLVSTVYIGLDHRFGDGPPLIFETMVFNGPGGEQAWRYSTREEALAGHANAVARARFQNSCRFADTPQAVS